MPDPGRWFRAGTPIPAPIAALDKPFPAAVSFLQVKGVFSMPDAPGRCPRSPTYIRNTSPAVYSNTRFNARGVSAKEQRNKSKGCKRRAVQLQEGYGGGV